jgi:hypothetical protein
MKDTHSDLQALIAKEVEISKDGEIYRGMLMGQVKAAAMMNQKTTAGSSILSTRKVLTPPRFVSPLATGGRCHLMLIETRAKGPRELLTGQKVAVPDPRERR